MAKNDIQIKLTPQNILIFLGNIFFIAVGIYYLTIPADIIADAIPLLGYFDDAALFLLLAAAAVKLNKNMKKVK